MDQLTLLIQSIHQFQELLLQFDAGNAEFELSKVVSNKAAIYFSAAEFTNQFRNLCAAIQYIVKMAIGLVQSKNMYCYRREGPPPTVVINWALKSLNKNDSAVSAE